MIMILWLSLLLLLSVSLSQIISHHSTGSLLCKRSNLNDFKLTEIITASKLERRLSYRYILLIKTECQVL